MIEQIFKWARVRRRMAASELGIILIPFALHLHSRGYTKGSITAYVRVIEHFGRWLKQEGLAIHKINSQHIQRFVKRHLPRCRCSRPAPRDVYRCRAALNLLRRFLRDRKLIRDSEESTANSQGLIKLLRAYDRHMHQVRGLAVATRLIRQHYAKEFLRWRFGRRMPVLHQLRPRDVLAFVTFRARNFTRSGTHCLTDAVRSFLRFLEFSGRIRIPLAAYVSRPVRRASPPLTKVLERDQWRTFSKSFDRSTPTGQRDYAMALCLGLLGLRGGEVVALSLEDLNWREMTLRLGRTKQQRERLLPLPDEVAKALVKYLQLGRPHTKSRNVFVCHRPPVGRALKVYQVGSAMTRAFRRSGIEAGGTHILRHSWATWAHRQGASLKLVADVLGHRSLDTTIRYAHLNLEELRQAALPWPETKP